MWRMKERGFKGNSELPLTEIRKSVGGTSTGEEKELF